MPFFIFAFIALASFPYRVDASLLSSIVSKIAGTGVQAAELPVPLPEVVHNSQNVPLLESSVNPDLKNMKDEPSAPAISPENSIALSNTGSLDVDSELDKYDPSVKITTYVVKKGDTLEGISAKLKVSQAALLASNADLKKSDLLKVGQKLVVLGAKEQSADKDAKTTKEDTKKVAKSDDSKKEDSKDIAKKDEKKDDGPMYTINTDLVKIETPLPASQPQVVAPSASEQPSGQPEGTITGNYIWPFPTGVGRVSQGLHADQAYDFAAPKGTPIYSIQNGTVLVVHSSGYNGGYGKYVVIDFDDGRQAIFGHMNQTVATEGQVVKQGDIIGYVGTTGKSTGNHTHIGFRGSLGNPYKGLKVNSTSIDHD